MDTKQYVHNIIVHYISKGNYVVKRLNQVILSNTYNKIKKPKYNCKIESLNNI